MIGLIEFDHMPLVSNWYFKKCGYYYQVSKTSPPVPSAPLRVHKSGGTRQKRAELAPSLVRSGVFLLWKLFRFTELLSDVAVLIYILVAVHLKKIGINWKVFGETVLLLQSAFATFSDVSRAAATILETLSYARMILQFCCRHFKKNWNWSENFRRNRSSGGFCFCCFFRCFLHCCKCCWKIVI